MLRFLFPTLTAKPARGAALFDAVVQEARQRHWYVQGRVEDSLDGRFAVLATVTALVLVRLEDGDEDGAEASVALSERFVEIMEAEHRELGLGDPTLGKKVRKLMSSLGRRVELWRKAVAEDDFAAVAAVSLTAADGGLGHDVAALRALWARMQATKVDDLAEGRLQ